MNIHEILLYLAIKHSGSFEKIYEELNTKKKKLDKLDTKKSRKIINDYEGEWITVLSPEYSRVLRSSHENPFVLFKDKEMDIWQTNPINQDNKINRWFLNILTDAPSHTGMKRGIYKEKHLAIKEIKKLKIAKNQYVYLEGRE